MASEESSKSADEFFISPAAAKLSIETLTSMKIHRQFVGYLAVLSTAAAERKMDNLKTNFLKFHNDYLLAGDSPPDRPYVQPFSEHARGFAQLSNKNVAGSYAPSSLRAVAPIRAVVEFYGSKQNVTQTLKSDHEEIALKVLADSQRIPVHSLATFLFRDYAIPRLGPDDIASVFKIFCEKFGYELGNPHHKIRFETLYAEDDSKFKNVTYAEQ